MFAMLSHLLVKKFYKPEGTLDYARYGKLGEHALTDKDVRVYNIPQKLAYIDIVAGMALILIGILFTYNVIPYSMFGKYCTIAIGTLLLTVASIYKIWSNSCYMGKPLTVMYNGVGSE